MKPTNFLVLAALAVIESVIAAPLLTERTNTTNPRFYNGSCTADTISIRKEWRNFSDEEKAAYIEAQKCLSSLPAQSDLRGVVCGISLLRTFENDVAKIEHLKDLALHRPPGIPQILH